MAYKAGKERKAFDTMAHPILHQKLEYYGVTCRSQTLAWFKSFLSERRQETSIGDEVSGLRNSSRIDSWPIAVYFVHINRARGADFRVGGGGGGANANT